MDRTSMAEEKFREIEILAIRSRRPASLVRNAQNCEKVTAPLWPKSWHRGFLLAGPEAR